MPDRQAAPAVLGQIADVPRDLLRTQLRMRGRREFLDVDRGVAVVGDTRSLIKIESSKL